MRFDRIIAIAQRKFSSIRRDKRMFAFIVIMPAIQIILFGLAIGATPTDLEVNVVGDNEVIEHLKDSNYLIINEFEDLDSAKQGVSDGEAWAVIQANGTGVILYLDASNQQISQTILTETRDAIQETSPAGLPIDIADPIFGEKEPQYIDFLAPGIMVLVCFMFSIILTTMSFVSERTDGTLDRVFAAGVSPLEVMLGHLLSFSTVLIGQVSVVILIAAYGFDIPIHGSIALLFMLGLLLGLASMCLGLFLSSKAASEFQAMQLTMPIMFPALLLSGILWPVEALPKWLLPVAWILPTTWAAEAFRSVMIRGWGLEADVVWGSILVIAAFGTLTITAAAKSLRLRS